MKFENNRGSTIIELLAAVFVLSVALVGALALTTSNLQSQGMGNARLVAVNLAREGVELARAIRDSNWLASEPWDKGLVSTTNKSCAVLPLGTSSFTFLSDTLCDSAISDPSYQMYRDDNERYYQVAAEGSADGVPFMYRRTTFQAICLIDATETVSANNACDVGASKIGTQVIAEVSWNYSGQTSATKVVEKLYNWR